MKMILAEENENNLVTRSNQLVNATLVARTNKINLRARKIFLGVVSLISPEDQDFHSYKMTVKELESLTGIEKHNLYRELHKICLSLVGCVLTIKEPENPKGFLVSSLFSTAEYKPDCGYVEFRFDPKLKPYLLQLKGNYLSYRYGQARQLTSDHSVSMYELCRQILPIKSVRTGKIKGFRTISLDEVRSFFGVCGKYKRYPDFRSKLIEPTQNELKKKSDLLFEFSPVKTGRKISALRFTVTINKKNIVPCADMEDEEEAPFVYERLIKKIKTIIPSPSEMLKDTIDLYTEKAIEQALSETFNALITDQTEESAEVFFLKILRQSNKTDTADIQKMSTSWRPKTDTMDLLLNQGMTETFVDSVLPRFIIHYNGRSNKNYDRLFVKWCLEDWEKHTKTYSMSFDAFPSKKCMMTLQNNFMIDSDCGNQLWRIFVSKWSEKPATKKTKEGWDCEFITFVENTLCNT